MADPGLGGGLRAWLARFTPNGSGRGRPRVPHVQQLEAADCGAACLAMVLGMFGRHVRLDELRSRTGSGRGGVSARALLEAGQAYGLRGRGVSLDVDELAYLPRGAVLHWRFDHFVVFDAVTSRGVRVVDPARGRRLVPLERFREEFTGVALCFEPGDGFRPGGRRAAGIARYLRMLAEYRGPLARILLTSLLVQLFALAVPLLIGTIVDRVVPRREIDLLWLLAAGLGAIVGFQVLATLVRAYLLVYLRTAFEARLNLGFVDHLIALPYSYFLNRPTGDLLVRYESNRRIRETLTSASVSTLLDGTLATLYLLLVVSISPAMAGLVLVLGLAHVSLFVLTQRRHRELMTESLEMQARSQSHMVEMLDGIETLKSMGAERRSVERWSHRLVDELNVEIDRGRLTAWVGSLTAGLNIGSPLLILVVGAALVLEGGLSLGSMLAVNALAAGLLAPLGSLVVTALELMELRSHVERLDDVMTHDPEQASSAVRRSERLLGRIELRDVSFRYGPEEPWVLRDVSVVIDPGAKIAIVGRSGAGKSTLARMLVGLFMPTRGAVLFDGKDLGGLELSSVRRQIGVVTQDARLFGTSVRENVALGEPDAPRERIERAARLAGIHEEIAAMPMGYDTLLVDGGASLSGGQRQRMAIARALLLSPPILVLDEATSDLDAITEQRISRHLDGLATTRIVVAHRLSTVADANLILVLDDGKVVERGRHPELMAAGGAYASLVAAQTNVDDGSAGRQAGR